MDRGGTKVRGGPKPGEMDRSPSSELRAALLVDTKRTSIYGSVSLGNFTVSWVQKPFLSYVLILRMSHESILCMSHVSVFACLWCLSSVRVTCSSKCVL